jgi:hypothetical protein
VRSDLVEVAQPERPGTSNAEINPNAIAMDEKKADNLWSMVHSLWFFMGDP